MSEETLTTPQGVRTLNEEVEFVQQMLNDLKNVLREQREMLKEQGFRLPPGTTTTLSDAVRLLDGVSARARTLIHERDQYRALADIAALINSSLDLEEVLNEVMDTIVHLSRAERGYLMLRNDITDEMEVRIARNLDRKTIEDSTDFQVSRSVVARAIESADPILTTNAQEDARFRNSESIISYSLRSILCVPLKVKGIVTGVIYIENKIQAGLFDESTRDLMQAFANQAAVAIENARLFARVNATLNEVMELKNLQDNVFSSMTSGVITTNHAHQVTLINRSAQAILQIMPRDGELKQLNLPEILPIMDTRFESLYTQALDQGEQFTGIEFDADMETRGRINLSVSFSPLKDAHDHTQGVALVVDDMTETKRREAQIAGVRRYLPAEVVDGVKDAASLKLGGTRQIISILFGDIRGFSTFSENLDPEKLVEIINTYMTIASDAIHVHQGVIDKFMGDAVMALYNTPLRPQEDHALRAIRSAAQMMADIRAYHEIVGPRDRLQFGVGVHTGDAVVGNVGSPERLDYTAMGDSVNLAKRLQEVAAPMQVLISDETYWLVADHIEVNELEPIQVKGRTQYTKVYELLRLK